MARPESRYGGGRRGRLFGPDLGRTRRTPEPVHPMKFSIIGLNHRTAPVEVREQLAFDDSSLEEALRGLKLHDGCAEAFILSTCNRVEVAVTTDEQADPQSSLLEFLCRS